MQEQPPLTNHSKAISAISFVTAALVVLLALGCFILSFEALWHFAERSGAIAVERAWVFPLVIDGSIIVFTVSALRCSIVGESERWPLTLVIISTGFSVLFNIAHAPGGILTALVSAMPPLLLFLAFESLMKQVRSNLRARGMLAVNPAVQLESANRTKGSMPAKSRSKQTSEKTASSCTAEKREEALRLLQNGVPKRAVARDLSMSLSTVRRLAASM